MILMNDIVEKRCIELGEYIVKNNSTVRQTAAVFGISKSTVHMEAAVDDFAESCAKSEYGIAKKQGRAAHSRRNCDQRKIYATKEELIF